MSWLISHTSNIDACNTYVFAASQLEFGLFAWTKWHTKLNYCLQSFSLFSTLKFLKAKMCGNFVHHPPPPLIITMCILSFCLRSWTACIKSVSFSFQVREKKEEKKKKKEKKKSRGIACSFLIASNVSFKSTDHLQLQSVDSCGQQYSGHFVWHLTNPHFIGFSSGVGWSFVRTVCQTCSMCITRIFLDSSFLCMWIFIWVKNAGWLH